MDEAGSPAHVRVSDADRDAVLEVLKDRTADGTLTLDEFAARADRALRARTREDLDAIVGDVQTGRSTLERARTARHHVISVMGGSATKGRWRCGDRVTAVAVMGGCHVDFRNAEITASEVHILAIAVMGGIDIVVPEGIEVAMDGLPVMGGRSMQVKEVPVLPGSPRIVVHAFPVMGGVTVRSRPRKQSRRAEDRALADAHSAVAPRPAYDDRPIEGTATIMFSDVCDYSGINDRLGDRAAHELLREHNELVRQQIATHGGREVKSNGDGFMVAFTSVTGAVRCAIALQHELAMRNERVEGEPIRVHIGIHAGDVVRDGDDYLGSTVIIASRLADAAGPEEILVSSVARDLAGGSRDFVFESPRTVSLKGFTETRQAYPVRWRPAPMRLTAG